MAFVLVGLLAAGCGTPKLDVGREAPRYLFELGKWYLADGDYLRAQESFKRFLDVQPGNAAADSAQFFLGQAMFKQKSYPEAAVEFAIFIREFPRSPLRDDAAFNECLCYVEQMRPPALDPTAALRARACLNEFLLRYPGTDHADATREFIQKINDRLAEKEYRLGVMFARQKKYRAALVYLDEVESRFPGSHWLADSLWWRARCLHKLGQRNEAVQTLRRMIRDYPQHEAVPEAEQLLESLDAGTAAQASRHDDNRARNSP